MFAGSLLVTTLLVANARADTRVNPSTEYLQRIKVGETVQPLGETPFGENVSMYTGAVGFRQNDISFPGIGPTITLTRSYEANGSPMIYTGDLPMADWDLSIPRITTIIPGNRAGSIGAWSTNSVQPDARCSQIGPISNGPYAFGNAWWHGYQLITGDGNSQSLMMRSRFNTLAPAGDVARYPIVTASHWMISCLPATANGMPGEAFLAVAPDGTRYWFNQLVYGAPMEMLSEAIPWGGRPPSGPLLTQPDSGADDGLPSSGAPGDAPDVYWGFDVLFMPRRVGQMYATRVEDRFGNWLSYSYSPLGQLIEINASDLRKVSIAWRSDAPVIDTITLQPGSALARVWRYEYNNPPDPFLRALARVVQPDQTAWSFAMDSASKLLLGSANPGDQCGIRTYTTSPSTENMKAITITHPGGLIGRFALSLRAHGRSYVPTGCYFRDSDSPPSEPTPTMYLTLALTTKTFSGPGVADQVWTYRYSPAQSSTASECAAAPCRETQWVEVTDPSSQTMHFTFSNRWNYSEGKLLGTVAAVDAIGTDSPTGLQTDISSYATPTQGPYPNVLGTPLEDSDSTSNEETSASVSPENLHQTIRQGVTFSRQVLSFDKYGQPETISRYSSLGSVRGETTTYWPPGEHWVLGQTYQVTDTASGKVISQTDYNGSLLPVRAHAFGLLQASYAYKGDGTMLSLTDPLNHVTALSQYYRGVPQRIDFADATVVAPVADDFGQVTSVQNQLGDSTAYGYDAMGRINRVSYPSGDATAWNDTLRAFVLVSVPEYGIPAGHWRQIVQTGNGKFSNFYDADWRPVLILTEDASNAASRSFVVKRYDTSGREVFSSYPVGTLNAIGDSLAGVATLYDALGRVTRTVQDSELGPLTTTTEYLPGFLTRVTNARGFRTVTSYQVFDTPSTDNPVLIQEPEGTTTTITRDSFGKPLQIKRSGG